MDRFADSAHTVDRDPERPWSRGYDDVLQSIGDPAAIAVYMLLKTHASDAGIGAYPSRARLAAYLRNSTPKAVDRSVKHLESLGLLSRFPRWKREDGTYTSVYTEGEKLTQTSNGFIIYNALGAAPQDTDKARETVNQTVSSVRREIDGLLEKAGRTKLGPTSNDTRTGTPPLGYDRGEGTRTGTPPGYPNGDTNKNPSLTKTPPPNPPQDPEPEDAGPDRIGGGETSSTPPGDGATAPASGEHYSPSVTEARRILFTYEGTRAEPWSASWRRGLGAEIVRGLESGATPEECEDALRRFDDGESRSPARYPWLLTEAREENAAVRDAEAVSEDAREVMARRRRERAQHAERVAMERATGRGADSVARSKGFRSLGHMLEVMREKGEGEVPEG